MNKIKIKELFSSIQGEGPYVGYKQLFIRFCGCNLCCNYCDTNFLSDNDCEEFDAAELADEGNKYKDIHSVSLTGGEPLLSVEFLKEFLPMVNKEIYLETNATLSDNFLEIKQYINIVSADIKLESSTGTKDLLKLHDKFFEACRGVETFAKVVFDENIADYEILQCCNLAKKYKIEIILQPKMSEDKMAVNSEFASKILDKFLMNYKKVRLIPQVHKFLNVR